MYGLFENKERFLDSYMHVPYGAFFINKEFEFEFEFEYSELDDSQVCHVWCVEICFSL